MSIILVCGGRDFSEKEFLFEVLDNLKVTPTLLIHGAANGADTLAGLWAKERGIKIKEYPADWKKHGRSAGYVRNSEMLEDGNPDLVIAFPGGRGTSMMMSLARKKNTPVKDILKDCK